MTITEQLDRYEASIATVEAQRSLEVVPLTDVIAVLTNRDLLEKQRHEQSDDWTNEERVRLINLDERTRNIAGPVANHPQMADTRSTFQPPESAWWWHLEPPAPMSTEAAPSWTDYDWFWNALTVTCLLFAGTFATSTAQAFSALGLDIIGLFSTVSQGAGLALVAGGALTDKGKEALDNILESLRIPTSLHAEVTFCFSTVILLVTYGLYSNLSRVGDYYEAQGKNYEKLSQWAAAEDQYKRAISFKEGEPELYRRLGRVYEELGNLENAEVEYQKGFNSDDTQSTIRLARVILIDAFQRLTSGSENIADIPEKLQKAQLYLKIAEDKLTKGDQRDTGDSKQGFVGESDEDRNMMKDIKVGQGILNLVRSMNPKLSSPEMKQYLDEAETNLKQASDLEYALPTDLKGRIAFCYHRVIKLNNIQKKTRNSQFTDETIDQLKPITKDCYKRLSSLPESDQSDLTILSYYLKQTNPNDE